MGFRGRAFGRGKSTLLKLVYCGAQAGRGQVCVDGRDITHLRAPEIPLLRRKVGVVFQDFQLLPQKTVWENVAFALQVIGAPQRRLVKDVPRALETVGLHHKADARPGELSGGEQQRVAIARAIVNDPIILLADEPTGNLDPQTAEDIAQVLQKINERGTTILMATHDRHLVDTQRRRVVRIADGRVASDEAQGVYHPEDDDPRLVNRNREESVGGGRQTAGGRTRDGSGEEAGSGSPPYQAGVGGGFHVPKSTPEFGRTFEEEETRPAAPDSAPDNPQPTVENSKSEDFLRHTRVNHALIGSPENPIVQLDRVK